MVGLKSQQPFQINDTAIQNTHTITTKKLDTAFNGFCGATSIDIEACIIEIIIIL